MSIERGDPVARYGSAARFRRQFSKGNVSSSDFTGEGAVNMWFERAMSERKPAIEIAAHSGARQ